MSCGGYGIKNQVQGKFLKFLVIDPQYNWNYIDSLIYVFYVSTFLNI